MEIKTEYRKEIEARNAAIVAEYSAMIAEGSQKSAAVNYITQKYGFHSTVTIYRILWKYGTLERKPRNAKKTRSKTTKH